MWVIAVRWFGSTYLNHHNHNIDDFKYLIFTLRIMLLLLLLCAIVAPQHLQDTCD